MDIQNPTPIGIKRCPTVSDHSVVLVVQSLSCIQRCDPVDCGPPGSSVHEIFQTRMLEWDAISFSGGFSWTRDWYMSPVLAGRFFTTKPPGKLTHVSVCVCVCVTQSCLTLCDSMDCSPPGSSVHGILQARIPEWVAISFSRGSSQPRDGTQASCTAGGCYTVCFTAPHVSSLQLNSTEAA